MHASLLLFEHIEIIISVLKHMCFTHIFFSLKPRTDSQSQKVQYTGFRASDRGGKSGYRPNLQKIVKEIRGVFVFLFLGGGTFLP